MMSYYIRTATYGTNTPHIIDEEAMYQAEHGINCLNADEFMYHCEAEIYMMQKNSIGKSSAEWHLTMKRKNIIHNQA